MQPKHTTLLQYTLAFLIRGNPGTNAQSTNDRFREMEAAI